MTAAAAALDGHAASELGTSAGDATPAFLPHVPQPMGFLRHRLPQRMAAWRRIGAPPHVLRWLHEGVRVEWLDGPPRPFHHGVTSFTQQERRWLHTEAQRCLATGAWRRALSFDFVSRAFIATHNGKPRLVIDLRWVNQHCRKRGTRYDSLQSLRRSMRRDDWMIAIDFADAYHHVRYHEQDVQYFTFALEIEDPHTGVVTTQYFQTPSLNFGWTNSPAVFTDVVKPVVRYLRNPSIASPPSFHTRAPPPPAAERGTRNLPWLDDLLFHYQAQSYAEALQVRTWVVVTLLELGWSIRWPKSHLDPTHFLPDHLGFAIDSHRGLFLLPERREVKLRQRACDILSYASRHRRFVPNRRLGSFQGIAQSSSLAVRMAGFWLRASYDDMHAQHFRWSGRTRLSRLALAGIREFTRLRDSPYVGRTIWLEPDDRVLHADAGPYGWGGELDYSARLRPAHGFWTPHEAEMHITWRELRAVRLLVRHYLPYLRRRRVLLYEDNQAVVAILTTLTSKSPQLMRELRLLVQILCDEDIYLRALYIRSAENVVADLFSRLAHPRDYCISRRLLQRLQQWWGAFTVDAFASPATARLPRFWTAVPARGAEATSAFSQQWHGEHVWAHPPPSLLPQVAQLLRGDSTLHVSVCAPYWPGQNWYAELLDMCDEMVRLPAGSLRRVAADAPAQLETWAVAVFHIPPGPRMPCALRADGRRCRMWTDDCHRA